MSETFRRPFSLSCAVPALTVIVSASVCLHAQATGTQDVTPSASAVPGSVSVWPTAGSLSKGTRLLLTTAGHDGTPYECKLESLDDRGIACRGPHHGPVVYPREMVRTVSLSTQHLRHAYVGFIITAALLTSGGLACALAGGGVGCAALLAAGLGSGLVAGILHSIDQLRRPGDPTPIYIAPTPAVVP